MRAPRSRCHIPDLRGLALALVLPAAVHAAAPETSALTEPAAVRAAESLFRDVGALSRRVTQCIDSGVAAQDCVCRFPAELARVRATAARIQRGYPAWKGKPVSWTDPASGQGRTIAVDAIAREANRGCPPR